MVQNQVFEWVAERKLFTVNWTRPDKIKDCAIRFTDSNVTNTGTAASNAGECSPYQAIRVFVILKVNFALDMFEFRIHGNYSPIL